MISAGQMGQTGAMTTDQSLTSTDSSAMDYAALQQSARDHLWMHFTRMSSYDNADVPVIVRGEGPVAKERLTARRKAWEDGAWIRDAAAAYAEKHARRAEAA